MTKIRKSIDALYAAREEITRGDMPNEKILNLMLSLVNDLIEVVGELAEENQQLQAELEAYQERGFTGAKLQ